jgi:hypothetical protein
LQAYFSAPRIGLLAGEAQPFTNMMASVATGPVSEADVEDLIEEEARATRRGPAPKLLQQMEHIQRLPKAQQRFVMQTCRRPAGRAAFLAAKEDDRTAVACPSRMDWNSPTLPCAHHQPRPGRRRAVNAPKPKGARQRAGLTTWRRARATRRARHDAEHDQR